MTSGAEYLDCDAPTVAQTLAGVCDAFDREWRNGGGPLLEEWLEEALPEHRSVLFSRLLAIELAHRALNGEQADESAYRQRFPEFLGQVTDEFEACRRRQEDSRERSQSSTDLWGRIAVAIDPVHTRAPGDAIGRYRLLERVGRGGFGEVWKAFDPELNRHVAIKLARHDRVQSPELIQQMRTEARRAAGLKHEGIVPVFDIVSDADGAYIVSEFVTGETLGTRLRRGPMLPTEAVTHVIDVARALHYAHSKGVVHRDVKPGNILLRAGGGAVITDFGLAATEEERVRERGGTFGTVRYMSPEQVRGETHTCDGRTDIYSVGVVLYELLTHRAPYPGESSGEYKQQVLTRPARPLRTIDERINPDLERICLKCLNKRMEDRFATCDDLARELVQVRRGAAPPWWKRRGLVAAAAVLLLGGVTATAVLQVMQNRRPAAAAVVGELAPGAAFRMVAWSPYDSNDSYGQRADEGRFVFDAFGQALFENGVNPGADFDANVVFSLEQNVGSAGLFWRLREGNDGERCVGVSVGRLTESAPCELWVQEYLIGSMPGGRMGVRSRHTFHRQLLAGPMSDRTRLRITADDTNLSQVWVNGTAVLATPLKLPAGERSGDQGGGWGVSGFNGTISILSVEPGSGMSGNPK